MGGSSKSRICSAALQSFVIHRHFYDVGEPTYMTTVDVQQLWRNLRGLPFRHSTNDRDYLKYYTAELCSAWSGAGFENEFYLADFCKHHAARIDMQFDFHLGPFFKTDEGFLHCFSYINLYPRFEIWGYEARQVLKAVMGGSTCIQWLRTGLGLYTRKRLPWGQGLPGFCYFTNHACNLCSGYHLYYFDVTTTIPEAFTTQGY